MEMRQIEIDPHKIGKTHLSINYKMLFLTGTRTVVSHNGQELYQDLHMRNSFYFLMEPQKRELEKAPLQIQKILMLQNPCYLLVHC